MKRLTLSFLLLATAACAPVGPDYQRPGIALTPTFSESSAGPIGEVATRAWWRSFNDPLLNTLVDRGLKQNLGIAGSLERIRAAEASLRATGVPSAVSGSLSGAATRSGSDTAATGTANTGSLSAGLVLDLFGGIRREREGAAADLAAAHADEGTARLAYLSSIVGAYIDARYYQTAMALTRQTIQTREETLTVTQQKYDAGSATQLDVAQVSALLDSARADLPGLEAEFLAQVYSIATLLGEPAAPLVTQMQRGAAQPRSRGGEATGIPADLLRNRPDVRSAEMALASATAAVGVATADLLPSLTLSGSVTRGGNNAWSFGPTVSLPLLSQPSLRASRDRAISEARQAEITWRNTVLGAVEDVQAAYSRSVRDRRTVDLLGNSVNSYARALQLSRDSYEQGALSLLDLLDTDRSLASARLSQASAVQSMAVDWATLQVALGAGAYVGSQTAGAAAAP
ncbi:efflux transporter outer membrane subunit [Paenirhodobacter populi]|uniref:efflux transporter outer membrane subunit n=1 Tax=Paenirhodobacter populi TaxID=2306993 RepID=UPI000FE41D21|nr:efflux transporter outer membrane subunit [Sinirhodobacter populi]RWR09045.1 efflux transporter outer membrane subunit [Sinirhodobacter populi]